MIGLCSLIFQLFCVVLSHLGVSLSLSAKKKHETRSWGGIIDRLQNITTRPFFAYSSVWLDFWLDFDIYFSFASFLLLLCFFFYTRDFWHLARELEEEDRRRNERKNEIYFTYGQTTKGESGFHTLFVLSASFHC